MKKILLVLSALIICNPVYSGQFMVGNYSTVSESQCNIELKFNKNGTGTFIESCRREDGSHRDDIEKYSISWVNVGNKITVTIKGSKEVFIYHKKLSCKSFAEQGSTSGLVGYGTEFWKTPIKCN